ncbi:TadE-like protein [Salinihabitans flavidus]|uniref:TadE-like protein n=1 Tax=Salinihabitans flavidus TaxID=569882 RepID=A0A1H8VTS9_9RHOB|nr:TadE/TadG family type IV pilus assembly protein [Salinihabitans flavidus]SEP18832.1 TadE-like protein [Salinihabitans flavidus]
MTGIGAIRAFLSDRRGSVAIEFAAIALPLMLLLGGSIEISRYVWTRLALQDAASTGARCLGLRLAPCFTGESMDRGGTVGFVKEQAKQWAIGIQDETITPEASAACHSAADFAKIAIRHQFTSVLAVLPETWIEVEACFPVLASE